MGLHPTLHHWRLRGSHRRPPFSRRRIPCLHRGAPAEGRVSGPEVRLSEARLHPPRRGARAAGHEGQHAPTNAYLARGHQQGGGHVAGCQDTPVEASRTV